MKKCVYCGENKKLSREHIFPRWIIKRQPSSDVRFARHENRVSERVSTIKDVCASCNNGVLSELDNYALELYDSYFERVVPIKGRVLFNYDYDLLARWMFKVLYNSARKNNTRPDELEPFKEYILGTSTRPMNFRIFSLLLRPHKLSSRVVAKLAKEHEGVTEILPRNISITQIGVQISEDNMLVLGRAVLINSYCFVVSILPSDIPRQFRRKLMKEITDNFKERYKGIQIIDPRLNRARLTTSIIDIVDMKKDSLSIFKEAYNDYFERSRRKKERHQNITE
jgi:hypothetical protein